MAIPETKLKAWAQQGAVESSKRTHEAIRTALDAYSWPVQYSYDVYLQGSYRNGTNIRGDSDVDVVAELQSSFAPNLSALDAQQQVAFHAHYSDATYGWAEFRAHVLAALTQRFGNSAIHEGAKAITVFGSGDRLNADVLVCQQRRIYVQFLSKDIDRYVEGVRFRNRLDGRWIDNFPKLHYANGADKNGDTRTGGWYKPTVRMFKNARTHLILKGELSVQLAPSYFLESLLYNITDVQFGGNYSLSFEDCLRWLEGSDFTGFVCQNGVVPLFGTTPEQWDLSSARKLVEELVFLWDYWY
jgi:hypothetical protein